MVSIRGYTHRAYEVCCDHRFQQIFRVSIQFTVMGSVFWLLSVGAAGLGFESKVIQTPPGGERTSHSFEA